MSAPLDFTYPALLDIISTELQDHAESQAFLAWVLKHYYRLDDQEVADAICDGPDDKGIDAIWVHHGDERIDVLQSKVNKNPDRTLGDVQLKEFHGTLSQLDSPDQVLKMIDTTSNNELRGLLIDQQIAALINGGYSVRGVFVTNATPDENASRFLAQTPTIIVVHPQALNQAYVPAERPRQSREPFSFDTFGINVAVHQIDKERTAAVFFAKASDLASMEGIASGELFDPNVRQWLGNTKVNKDIATSVKDPEEHKNFPLYHNGVTLICTKLEPDEGKLTVHGYSIINGCQSLSTIYNHRESLSGDLRILTRVVQIPDDIVLIDKITHNTNNQNGIKARDFKSNSPIQIRLQNEFRQKYGDCIFYQISRGERSTLPTILDNELAARILLAFDVREPWSAHQAYRLFDDLYPRIFGRPEVTADRIWTIYNLYQVVVDNLTAISHQRFARYTLTKYFLLYLLAEALSTDDLGRELIRDPLPFIDDTDGMQRLRASAGRIVADLIVDLNHEIQDREAAGEPVDYKRELKSPTAARALARPIITSYEKLVQRGRLASFSEDWNNKD